MTIGGARILKGKGRKVTMTVEFDEGDDILSCISQAMEQHGISDGKIASCIGCVKTGRINFFEKGSYAVKDLADNEVVASSGKFVKTKDGYKGDLHILVDVGNGKRQNGTLMKGTAAAGMKLGVEYVHYEE